MGQTSAFIYHFKALGGPNELQLFCPNAASSKVVALRLEEEARAIERRYSRYLEDSIVSRINASAGKGRIEVDEETAALLDYAALAYRQSAGLFDITSGILRRAWDFKTARVPSMSQLAELLPLIGWQKVEWNKPFIRLPSVGMQLDFGGIGKEFAVDRLAALAIELGCTSCMVNLGGDVAATGPKPDGTPWSIGIADPRGPGRTVASVPLIRGAIATSGDYQRFFEVDGKRYCHILNPFTGMPVTELRSVSVIAESCLVAGTASTVTMLKGADEGFRFLIDAGFSAMIIDEHGALRQTGRACPA